MRERSADNIVSAVNEMISNTGYEELSLLSLSSLDHSQIGEIVEKLLPYARDHMLSISIPSTRVDAFNVKVASNIAEVRKTGLTFAPEAGSQKMRDAINKQITHEDIINTAKKVKSAGWQRLKLYFMVGFPDETEEDIRQIGELIKEVKKVGFFDLTASVNMLIPKPHSAFQFAQLQPPEYMQTVRKILGPYRNFAKIDISDGKKSFIEGSFHAVMALSVIEKAYKMGYYDEWASIFIRKLGEFIPRLSYRPTSVRMGDNDFPWNIG